jgi:SAM-dependent methyltransferase
LGYFDCVIAIGFLHHLGNEEIRNVLTQARGCLRPSGTFYSADPSRRRFVRLFTSWVRQKYDQHHSPDERELYPDQLAAIAREVDFASSTIGYVDYFLGPLAWLAPQTPAWLSGPLEWFDNASLSVPYLRRFASSFSLLAHVE